MLSIGTGVLQVPPQLASRDAKRWMPLLMLYDGDSNAVVRYNSK